MVDLATPYKLPRQIVGGAMIGFALFLAFSANVTFDMIFDDEKRTNDSTLAFVSFMLGFLLLVLSPIGRKINRTEIITLAAAVVICIYTPFYLIQNLDGFEAALVVVLTGYVFYAFLVTIKTINVYLRRNESRQNKSRKKSNKHRRKGRK